MSDHLAAVQVTRTQPRKHVTGVVGADRLHSQSSSRNVVQKHLNTTTDVSASEAALGLNPEFC